MPRLRCQTLSDFSRPGNTNAGCAPEAFCCASGLYGEGMSWVDADQADLLFKPDVVLQYRQWHQRFWAMGH